MRNITITPSGPLRIEHVLPTLAAAGMETVVLRLTRALSRAGHDVGVTCIEELGPLADELRALGVPVSLVRTPGVKSNFYAPDLRAWFSERQPHVMHVHSGAWLKAATAARRSGVPRIVHTMHGLDEPPRWFGPVLKHTAARATDAVLAVSLSVRDYLVHTCHVNPARVTVVLNGISTGEFHPGGDRRALRARLGAGPDGPVVGHVARLAPVKNQALLLRGFSVARQSHPDAILVIAGDGPERRSLMELSESLGLGGSVFFLGEVRDTAALYRDFDIFALTSLAEGTSMSMLEALASGDAVVATAVGGNMALLDHGRAGVLIPSEDVVALGTALAGLMADDARRCSLAAAGRIHVEQVYSEQAMVERHLDIYRRGRAALGNEPCAA